MLGGDCIEVTSEELPLGKFSGTGGKRFSVGFHQVSFKEKTINLDTLQRVSAC